MVNRIDELNRYVLKKIGGRIKAIGKLNASEVNAMSRLGAMGADLDDIKRETAKITQKNISEIDEIFEIAKTEHYDFAAKYFAKRGLDADTAFLADYVESVKAVTKEQYLNISKTTGFDIDGYKSVQKAYREAIDKAVYLVSAGVKDYKSAIRDMLRKLGESGLKTVEYKSGAARSLESAVKMNVLDGVREVNAGMSRQAGEKYGADGVEISVHANSAPDHEDIQGRQFTYEEFDKLQNQMPFKDVTGRRFAAIKRPIGMWNCGHYTFDIIIGVSEPAYGEKDLRRYKAKNAKGFTYEGHKYTGYEAEQTQNRIKSEYRKARGAFELAESAGDSALAGGYRYKMTVLEHHYNKFSAAAKDFYAEPLTNFEESSNIITRDYRKYERQEDISEAFKRQADGISGTEKENIRDYTGNLHFTLNQAARGGGRVGDPTDPKYDKYLKDADKSLTDLLERSRVPEDVTAWRGAELRTISQSSVLSKLPIEKWKGRIIDDKSFVSTSILERGANKRKEAFMEISVPKGAKGLYINEVNLYKDIEFELLLQKGTNFMIKDVRRENGKIFLWLEVIL
jgi:hypothetical protein